MRFETVNPYASRVCSDVTMLLAVFHTPGEQTPTPCGIVRTRVPQCARAFLDSLSLNPWRFHTVHRDIHTDFPWEGRGEAALWSALQPDTGDRKGGRHSKTRIGPVDLHWMAEAGFVVPGGDQEPRAFLPYGSG